MTDLRKCSLKILAVVGIFCLASPAIAAGTVQDVTKFGVKGDGETLNTAAIQKAIDDCAAAGGGTVDFPKGRYVTGTIEIKTGVSLRIEEGATLLGSTDPADYRNLDPFIAGDGVPLGYALIVAVNASHVGIEGNGTIDGRGPALRKKQKNFTVRPFLIRWVHCNDVTVRDVHLNDPGAWTLHFSQTKGATVDGVTIRTRFTNLRNNDGIDIDSSENVRVRKCDINSEDDAIVIKATGADPSRDIQVSNCKLSSHTNAIKLGTESFGGFSDISISNCQVYDTDMAGIALYEVDGADLQKVSISDVSIDGVSVPICVRLGTRYKTFRDGQKPKDGGTLRDVTIKNITAKNVKLIGMLVNGVPGHPIERLTLQNIQMELPGGGAAEAALIKLPEKQATYPEFNMFGKTLPASGTYARHIRGVTFDNVRMTVLTPDARPQTLLLDAQDITPPTFGESPAIIPK